MSTISNPAELRRRGIEVLVPDLGYADAMRFLQQFGAGRVDYTADRDRLGSPDDEHLQQADKLADQEQRRDAVIQPMIRAVRSAYSGWSHCRSSRCCIAVQGSAALGNY